MLDGDAACNESGRVGADDLSYGATIDESDPEGLLLLLIDTLIQDDYWHLRDLGEDNAYEGPHWVQRVGYVRPIVRAIDIHNIGSGRK